MHLDSIETILKNQVKSKKKTFQKGEIIFHEDAPAFGLYYQLEGCTKIYTTNHDGKEIILRLIKKNEFFGHGCLFGRDCHTYSAKSLQTSDCYFFERINFENSLRATPQLTHIFLKELGTELNLYQKKCTELIKKNVRERLASYFQYMIEHHSEDHACGTKINLQLTRDEIASIIGSASETVIRFISEFKELGVVTEREKFFHILDTEKLSKMSRTM